MFLLFLFLERYRGDVLQFSNQSLPQIKKNCAEYLSILLCFLVMMRTGFHILNLLKQNDKRDNLHCI